jgi:hypothetical protein
MSCSGSIFFALARMNVEYFFLQLFHSIYFNIFLFKHPAFFELYKCLKCLSIIRVPLGMVIAKLENLSANFADEATAVLYAVYV